MFIVTVNFVVAPEHRAEFATAMDAQATNSLDLESDCHQFDVSVATDNECSFFLYEKYTNAEAFDVHLNSPHFVEFDALVMPWVSSKSVATWVEREA